MVCNPTSSETFRVKFESFAASDLPAPAILTVGWKNRKIAANTENSITGHTSANV